jgi:TolB-like protein/DNA-binding SARP family transcriptional activator
VGYLEIELLGGLSARTADGEELLFPTRKARLLLAFLAVEPGRAHPRDRLTNLLWAGRGDEQARGSLRNALSSLRRVLGADAVAIDKDRVALVPDAVTVDVVLFQALAAQDDTLSLTKAAGLYLGDLLDGHPTETDEFEEWLAGARARLRETAGDLFARLVAGHRAAGDLAAAIAAARRRVDLDPLYEEGHRQLMQLYAEGGRRNQAVRHFEDLARRLASDLGVKPEPETLAMIERIKAAPAPAAADAVVAPRPAPALSPTREGPAPVPNRPSIVVFPFDNVGGCPEQGYFADGLATDITNALSRFKAFFVISSQSSLALKGRNLAARDAANELGVRYFLEGSVRRGGDRLRLSAQLVDASTSTVLWGDYFDGEVGNLFDFQDRITEGVVGILEPAILRAEIERARAKRPENLGAYDYAMRAMPNAWALTKDESRLARELCAKAIELDPAYSLPYAIASWCHGQEIVYNWSSEPDAVEHHKAEALRLARIAMSMDANDPFVLTMLSTAECFAHDIPSALAHVKRSLAIDRNLAWSWYRSGWIHNYMGEVVTAVEHFENALRLSPFDPLKFGIFMGIGQANFVAGNYDTAIDWIDRGIAENPKIVWVHRLRAACAALAGRQADAEWSRDRVLEYAPGVTAEKIANAIPHTNPKVRDLYIKALRKAGFD